MRKGPEPEVFTNSDPVGAPRDKIWNFTSQLPLLLSQNIVYIWTNWHLFEYANPAGFFNDWHFDDQATMRKALWYSSSLIQSHIIVVSGSLFAVFQEHLAQFLSTSFYIVHPGISSVCWITRGVHLSLIRQFNTHLYTWATIRFRDNIFEIRNDLLWFDTIQCNLIQFLTFI